jgi:hypothetical protein
MAAVSAATDVPPYQVVSLLKDFFGGYSSGISPMSAHVLFSTDEQSDYLCTGVRWATMSPRLNFVLKATRMRNICRNLKGGTLSIPSTARRTGESVYRPSCMSRTGFDS